MKFDELGVSVFEGIFSQLDYLTIVVMLMIFPQLEQYAKPYMNSTYIIKRMCKKYNLRYEDLLSRMTPLNPNGGTILFGGMVTNFVLGNDVLDKSEYEEVDFDLIHYIYKDGLYCPLETDLEIMNGHDNQMHSTYPLMDITTPDEEYPLYFIKKDVTAIDNRKYDHCTLGYATDSLADYIKDMCDFSVSQVYYDPKNPELFINNIDEYINRRFTVNINEIAYKEFKRYRRLYPEYGEFSSDMDEYCRYHPGYKYNRIIDRIKKYKEKGFQVDITDTWISYSTIDAYGLIGSDPYYMKHILEKVAEEHATNGDLPVVHFRFGTEGRIWRNTDAFTDYYKKYMRDFKLRPSKYIIKRALENIRNTDISHIKDTKTSVNIPIYDADDIASTKHITVPYYHASYLYGFETQMDVCYDIRKLGYYKDYLLSKYDLIDNIQFKKISKTTMYSGLDDLLKWSHHDQADFVRKSDVQKRNGGSPSAVIEYELNRISLRKFPWNFADFGVFEP